MNHQNAMHRLYQNNRLTTLHTSRGEALFNRHEGHEIEKDAGWCTAVIQGIFTAEAKEEVKTMKKSFKRIKQTALSTHVVIYDIYQTTEIRNFLHKYRLSVSHTNAGERMYQEIPGGEEVELN